jgi:hypothetical protein
MYSYMDLVIFSNLQLQAITHNIFLQTLGAILSISKFSTSFLIVSNLILGNNIHYWGTPLFACQL